jgi:hypothetical protein
MEFSARSLLKFQFRIFEEARQSLPKSDRVSTDVGRYSARGMLLTPLTKKQIKAVEKMWGGKVKKTTFHPTCKSRPQRWIRAFPPPLRLPTYETRPFTCSEKQTFSLANDPEGRAANTSELRNLAISRLPIPSVDLSFLAYRGEYQGGPSVIGASPFNPKRTPNAAYPLVIQRSRKPRKTAQKVALATVNRRVLGSSPPDGLRCA